MSSQIWGSLLYLGIEEGEVEAVEGQELPIMRIRGAVASLEVRLTFDVRDRDKRNSVADG